MVELTKEERGYLVDCLRLVSEADPNGAALRELADRLAEAEYVLVGASGILDCSEPGRVTRMGEARRFVKEDDDRWADIGLFLT